MLPGLSPFFDELSAHAMFVLDPAHRLYWGGLLASLLIAIVAIRLQGRPLSLRFLRRVFLSRRYWFNASTRVDIRYAAINMFVNAILATVFVSGQLAFTMVVAKVLQQYLGTSQMPEIPWAVIATAYTLTFFVAEDLTRFLLHMAMHKVPALWHFHRLHHGATTLTPLTVNRVHPVETCLYFLRGVLAFGVVSGAFVYLFGSRLTALDILGVNAFGFLFNVLGANLRHSHVWLGFGRLERLFISPAQHQIHHSSDPAHADSNFGTCLALWDRLAGSWIAAGRRPRQLRFGLGKMTGHANATTGRRSRAASPDTDASAPALSPVEQVV